jgi:hypothetical protein
MTNDGRSGDTQCNEEARHAAERRAPDPPEHSRDAADRERAENEGMMAAAAGDLEEPRASSGDVEPTTLRRPPTDPPAPS